VTRETVRRSEAIDGISPSAKAAAKAAGLANNQRALIEISKQPKSKQIAKVKQLAARKHPTQKKDHKLPAADAKPLEKLIELWNDSGALKKSFIEASDRVGNEFIAHIRQERKSTHEQP